VALCACGSGAGSGVVASAAPGGAAIEVFAYLREVVPFNVDSVESDGQGADGGPATWRLTVAALVARHAVVAGCLAVMVAANVSRPAGLWKASSSRL